MSKEIHAWIKHVETELPRIVALANRLEQYGATVDWDSTRRNLVGTIPLVVEFKSRCGAVTTIFFQLLNHETDSDVLITNMTTLPPEARSQGLGQKAINTFLVWARECEFQEVRATQVAFPASQRFWEKCEFVRCADPNPYGDYIIRFS